MKTISSQLQAAIEAGKICTLVKIVRRDGQVLGFTDHDAAIAFAGTTFIPGAGLKRARLSAKANQEVSSQEVEAAWITGISETDLSSGLYDECSVEFSWISWENPALGNVVVFSGTVGMITWTQDGFVAEVVNSVKKLQRKVGTIITPNCRHVLGSTGIANIPGKCGVNLAAVTFTGTVQNILTQRRSFTVAGNAAAQNNGYFTGGRLLWTSGLNAGQILDVKVHTKSGAINSLEFYLPSIQNIAVGDAYNVTAGCDKTLGVCKSKFNNVVNFGGFPYLQPEANTK